MLSKEFAKPHESEVIQRMSENYRRLKQYWDDASIMPNDMIYDFPPISQRKPPPPPSKTKLAPSSKY